MTYLHLEHHYQFKNLHFFLRGAEDITQATTEHTSAVFHQNKHFINARGNLIDSTPEVGDGILVARQKFLEHFFKNKHKWHIVHFLNAQFSKRDNLKKRTKKQKQESPHVRVVHVQCFLTKVCILHNYALLESKLHMFLLPSVWKEMLHVVSFFQKITFGPSCCNILWNGPEICMWILNHYFWGGNFEESMGNNNNMIITE